MLKIKDDVELEELEKFGFKPKYDEDTGKVIEYRKLTYGKKDEINAERVVMYFKPRTFGRIFKVRAWISLADWSSGVSNEYMDTLYDLIQAGLVEKLEEK